MWSSAALMWRCEAVVWPHVTVMWSGAAVMWSYVIVMQLCVTVMWSYAAVMWSWVNIMWPHVTIMWSCYIIMCSCYVIMCGCYVIICDCYVNDMQLIKEWNKKNVTHNWLVKCLLTWNNLIALPLWQMFLCCLDCAAGQVRSCFACWWDSSGRTWNSTCSALWSTLGHWTVSSATWTPPFGKSKGLSYWH